MAYQSIFKNKITPSNTQPAQTTGYKSILSKQTPITNTNTTSTFTPRVGEKIGDIVNRTLSGGGVYKIKVGDPTWKAPNSHTTYGGVDTKTGYERADIVPTSLSGVNASSSNITLEKNLPAFDNGTDKTYRTATDKYLGEVIQPQLKSGQISLREAQIKAVSYLQNKQMGLDSSNINLGGKAGEIADNIVNFFKGLQQTKQPEISTKDLAKKIAIPQNEQGKQTLKQGKPSIIKREGFSNGEQTPAQLNLKQGKPQASDLIQGTITGNWAFAAMKTLAPTIVNAAFNTLAENKTNLINTLAKFTATKSINNTSAVEKPILNNPIARVANAVKLSMNMASFIPAWLEFQTGMKTAENIPGLSKPTQYAEQKFGQLTNLPNIPINAGINAIPSKVLSDESKAEIIPVIDEIVSFATQIGLLHIGIKVVGKFTSVVGSKIKVKQDVGIEVTPEITKEIVNEVKTDILNENYQKSVETLVKDPTPENLQKAVDSKPAVSNNRIASLRLPNGKISAKQATQGLKDAGYSSDEISQVLSSTKESVVNGETDKGFFNATDIINNTKYLENNGKLTQPEPIVKPQEAQGKVLPTEPTIKTSEVKTSITDPLTLEAQKYKTAEEFVRKESFNPNSKIEYHLSDNPNLVEGKTFAEQTKPTNIGERGFAGKEENIGQVFSTKNPQQWSAQLNYEGNNKPQYVYLVEVKNPTKPDIMEGLPHQSISSPEDIKVIKKIGGQKVIDNPSLMEQAKTSQLTDIWNRAQVKEATKETFTPKLAQSNRQKAIDLGVKESEFKNLPEVEKINLQEQFNKAKDYIDKNNEKAKEILKGNEPLPEGINATQFLAATEKYLKENPSKDLAFEIANSELARAASLAGQEVVSAKLREPDSFTAKIIELKKAREPKIQDIGKKRSVAKKSLKEEMSKDNLSKEDLSWESFLSKIEC